MGHKLVNGKGKTAYGRNLAHAKLTASQKALFVAQAARGETAFAPSATQLARAMGISPAIVSKAGKLRDHPALEADVAAGRTSVAMAVKLIPAVTSEVTAPVLVTAATVGLPPVTDDLIDHVIAQAGPARVWDHLSAALD
jgi:hypothetical protein